MKKKEGYQQSAQTELRVPPIRIPVGITVQVGGAGAPPQPPQSQPQPQGGEPAAPTARNPWPWILGILAIVIVAAIALPLVFKTISGEIVSDRVELSLSSNGFKWESPRRVGNFARENVGKLIGPACSLAIQQSQHNQLMDSVREANKFTLDTMRLRLEQQKAVALESLRQELWKTRARVAKLEAERKVEIIQPKPESTSSFTFTWINNRQEACEVWIDGVSFKRTLKPAESVKVTANTPVTCWARGLKTGNVWKIEVTKEKVLSSSEKILEIY